MATHVPAVVRLPRVLVGRDRQDPELLEQHLATGERLGAPGVDQREELLVGRALDGAVWVEIAGCHDLGAVRLGTVDGVDRADLDGVVLQLELEAVADGEVEHERAVGCGGHDEHADGNGDRRHQPETQQAVLHARPPLTRPGCTPSRCPAGRGVPRFPPGRRCRAAP
ncbi:MAG: hypothetical protein R2697_22580 [Ilumatobacteraceae bacterium]